MHPASLVLSVVVPMYNESDVIDLFVRRLRPVLDGLDVGYEVVCVDDGSRDDTAAQLAGHARTWAELRLVRLLRNSGHQAALTSGMAGSRGQYVVTIDADLQDPPEVIAEMLENAVVGQLDVVYGVRSDRSSDSVLKRSTAGLYYRLVRRLVGQHVPHDAGDFRLISRRVVEAIEKLPPHGRVYRLLIPWFGFPSAEVGFHRAKRAAGSSKYPLSKMVVLAVESITSFSAAPLRLATWGGIAGAGVCSLLAVVVVVGTIFGRTVPGWASTVLIVGFMGGLQLLCLGLLGEYVGRLYAVSQERPPYVVGFDSLEAAPDDVEPRLPPDADGRVPELSTAASARLLRESHSEV